MTLIRYNPNNYKPATFSNFIDRFFNDDFSGGKSVSKFSPQVDIAETENQFEIEFYLPGMKREDINIDVQEDRLTVSGERKMENEKKEKNFHSVESYYGTFIRSFYLPDNASVDKIDASYKDGVLQVIVPKDAKKETRKKISIK